jgi:hypothetical protein
LEDEGSSEVDPPPKIIGMKDGLLGPKGEPDMDEEEGYEPDAEEKDHTGYYKGVQRNRGKGKPRRQHVVIIYSS